MPHQVPREDHPWRKWQGPAEKARSKSKKKEKPEQQKREYKPIDLFLKEILTSWDRVEVSTYAWGRESKYKLRELPDKNVALWLANLLRRFYA